MAKLINNNKLDSFANKLWKRIAKSFVSKTLPNNVIGETIFKDGYIEGGILSAFNNKSTQMYNAENGGCFGIPATSISAGIKVGKIAIAVKDDLAVGSTVTNVVALAVRKSNNEVKESIVQNGTATVFQNQYSNINAQKIAYININKTFDEEVYFVVGCTNMLWNTDTHPRANVYGSSTIPAVGAVLGIQNYHYSGRIIVFSERMSFSEVIHIKNDSVSKTKDNILTGKTILQDGYIDGELYSYNNSNATGLASGNGIYSGTNNKIIQPNQHVTSIVIAVNNDFELGSTVTGVNIGVVRNSNNQVMEYIVQNGTATVVENNYPQKITATKVINVVVDKKWTEDVYLLVGANGMLWGSARGTSGVTTATGGDRLPSVGSTINNLNTSNYIGKVVVLGSNISLNTITSKVDVSEIGNAPNKIPRVGTNGKLDPSILPAEQNGGVRTVNDQSPNQNGNVTVLAEHIKYHANTNTNMKQAIDGKPNTVNGQSQNNGNITIYSDNININSSTNQTIKQALDERVHKNQDNIFTKHNRFNDYSPTVHRVFTRAFIKQDVNNGNIVGYDVNRYCAYLNEKYNDNNKQVSHVLLPIKNAQVGQNVTLDIFAFNRNNRVISTLSAGTYPIIDEEIAGCKCAKIPVNINTGSEGIGFGFMLSSNNNGHSIACVRSSTGNNNAWSATTRPNVNTSISTNSRIEIPYKICYETASELVTRFELENVTQMYPRNMIGEMKQLAYDGGNSLEDGTNTWLRANGQAINGNDYPELYEKFNTSRTDDDIEVSIPSIDSQVGYYYICAK